MQQQQQQQHQQKKQQEEDPILAFLRPLIVCIRENAPGEDDIPTMICVGSSNVSSCDAFAAELIRSARQAEPNQPHVLRRLGEDLHEFIMAVAEQKVRRIHFLGNFVAWPEGGAFYPPHPPVLTKLELETLSMSILRARRALVLPRPRRLHGSPRYRLNQFLLVRVRRMRMHKEIGKTLEERRATRAAARFPGVRQMLRRRDDGNELAGVFKRTDMASVVAEYLGYAAW